MRFACFLVLVSAVAISAGITTLPRRDLRETQEIQDIVNYLEYNVSPRDIHEILEVLPEAKEGPTEEENTVAMPRSIVSIPWKKITDYLQKMAKNNSKFAKVLNLVNDEKFRDLVKRAVNSHTLAEFVKGVATHGFSWTEFLHLLLHALCSTATTIQHDKYSVGACQILQNL